MSMHPTPNRRKSYTLVTIQFVCLVVIALTGPLIASNLLLLTIELAGVALGVWAILVMRPGRFNITPDINSGGEMVNHGPYRWIRHPMYAALLLVTLPLVLTEPTLLRWATWLLLLADLVIKLNYEEHLLSAHYPDYSKYRATTNRLIPFIY